MSDAKAAIVDPRAAERRLDRRLQALIFGLAFLSYAYFMQAGAWNHNSRFDVARALVEQRTLQIDSYRLNTGDLSYWGGHYYSDKAPLTGVVAAIPYAAIHLVRPLLPDDWQYDRTFYRIGSYVATLFTSGLAAAVTALLLFRFARKKGATPRTAVGVAAVYAIGSYAFPFATVLFGHDLAAALLFGSFYLAADEGGWKRYMLAGFVGALAVVAEYPIAGAAVVLGLCLAWNRGRAGALRFLVPYAAGALLPAVLGGAYMWICFGDIFTIAYRHVALGQIGKAGAFGLSYPKPLVIFKLLFGIRRGLFIGAPVLALCTLGLGLGLRKRAGLTWMWPCAFVCIYYVLFLAAFEWWDGGASFGPRHLIPMLPFLCLGGFAVIDRWPKVFFGLASISALVMLAGTGQTPIPAAITSVYGTLQRVYLNMVPDMQVLGVMHPRESTNIGLLAGLDGTWSLVPVIGLWMVFAFVIWRQLRTIVPALAVSVPAPVSGPRAAQVTESPADKVTASPAGAPRAGRKQRS